MVGIKSLKEVPKNCIECPYGIYLGSISFCPILGDDEIDIQENMLKGTRYEHCPLVETEERKVGKWIRKSIRNDQGGCIGAEMICSCCNKDNRHDEYMDFCPNCGCRMTKED
jgi:hypothetical protein